MASGAGYALGQFPIAGFKEEISQIETENIALQSQVEELNKDNNDIQELLEATLANLSETQSAYQNLFEKYLSVENNLTEIQYGFEQLLTSYEEVKNQLEGIDFNNSVLLSLYSSLWETYSDLLLAYNDLTSGPPLELTEYIRNGDFDDPIIFDPNFNIPYWYEPGSGGSIGFSSSSGRTGRAIGLHPGKIIQKLDLPISGATLSFWILPNPNSEYSTMNVYFDGEIIYQNTFTGIIEDYDWNEVILVLDFVPGIHYLTFEVTTPNTVRIDDVSLVG